MPELDDVLAAHVAWLRLLRRSERTIYERQRAVIRLAAWLGAKVTASDDGTHGLDSAGVFPEAVGSRGGGVPWRPPPARGGAGGGAAAGGGPAPPHLRRPHRGVGRGAGPRALDGGGPRGGPAVTPGPPRRAPPHQRGRPRGRARLCQPPGAAVADLGWMGRV